MVVWHFHFRLFSMFYSLKHDIIVDDMEWKQLVKDWIDSKFSFNKRFGIGQDVNSFSLWRRNASKIRCVICLHFSPPSFSHKTYKPQVPGFDLHRVDDSHLHFLASKEREATWKQPVHFSKVPLLTFPHSLFTCFKTDLLSSEVFASSEKKKKFVGG